MLIVGMIVGFLLGSLAGIFGLALVHTDKHQNES